MGCGLGDVDWDGICKSAAVIDVGAKALIILPHANIS
ncbi:hypothetical protein Arad_9158 [Rhizobium rhizogenes K84]|uniref:Uncharacterized protein n=1 Tax=Rhizobium rhizogenes (strain K84 / ATCC BAA-868) TaxID=311403 RepID=B9JK15_RHIR8|nr:hypothetical protein Arad_9158 [Rhizobium rhizogenes K84]